MKHSMNLKQECFQRKLVRFDKKKHRINPWLTSGILKSINFKDKLYKTLMQTSKDSTDYPVLLSNFKVYKNIIRRSIMLAKRDYYRNAFNRYSTNMKKTWQTINQTLNRRKRDRDFPQEFKLANGNTISEPKKMLMLLMISLLALAMAEYQMKAPTMISIDICQVRLIAL